MAALVAGGCAGGDDDSESAGEESPPAATTTADDAPAPNLSLPATTTAPSAEQGPTYTRAQLPRLALQPSDAPSGMRYTRAESGRKTLFEVGIALDTQTRELRSLGFRAVYDAIFDRPNADLRLA